MNRFVNSFLLLGLLSLSALFWACGGEGSCKFDADCEESQVCQQGKCATPSKETRKDAGSFVEADPPRETPSREVECQDGHTRKCYSGKDGTSGVGLCTQGTQTCQNGKWSPCKDEVVPTQEICNTKDDNCDGQIDEGCDCQPGATQPCYTGPDGTQDVGLCKAGTQTCDNNGKWEACSNDVKPQKETCNGQDDDCNGKVDDNLNSPPDCKNTKGACKGAKQQCGGAKGWLPCDESTYTQHNNAYEKEEKKCDSIDNDCDGQTDEKLERPCFNGSTGCKPNAQGGFQCEGVCKAGTQICRAGQWDSCQGQVTPQTETCNSKDDNCDGKVDEVCVCKPGDKKDCYNGPAGTSGVGICSKGKQTCLANGQWGTCSGEIKPRQEICDGQDNNCDGKTDEGLTGPACQKSFGVCAGVRQKCGGTKGWLPCKESDYQQHTSNYQAQETKCDNKDNDCDGSVDENLTQNCYSGSSGTAGKGECKSGTQTCLNGVYTKCQGEIVPTTESCNGKDDNCDGQVDNNIPGVGASCTVTGQKGECAKGKKACQNNQVTCQQVNQPKAENCTNQKDDDCNGKVDDCGVCTNGSQRPCYAAKAGCIKVGSSYQCKGICKTGTQTCVNGQWNSCQGEVNPGKEVCNWKDDDCNGRVDDQGACLFSSWSSVNMPSGAREVSYLDANVGVAVGSSGKIWRTSNGGQSWGTIASPTTSTLYRVVAMPQGLVLAVGSSGTIVRSINGGRSFQKVSSGTTRTLYGVAASLRSFSQYALAVGSGGTILTSLDGGKTWSTRTSGTTSTLYGAAFSSNSSSRMIAVGASGTIVTSIGGTTWTRRTSGTTATLRDVVFHTSTGIAVGFRVALRGSSTGQTWTPITLPNSPSLTRVVTAGSETFVAAGSGSKYYVSFDNGQTFVEKNYGISGFYTSIAMRSSTALVAVASGKAAQGEGPLRFQEQRPSFTFYDVAYSNQDSSSNTTAIAVGTGGALFRSTDSGGTWQRTYIPTSRSLYSVSFYGNDAIVVGSSGTLFTSSDKGKTWVKRSSGTSSTLYGVVIYGSYAFAVGSSGTLLRSTNKGVTWTKQTPPSRPSTGSVLYGLTMKKSTVIAVGSNGWVIRSTDNGASWTRVGTGLTTNTLRGVYYYSLNNTVVAAGMRGTILYSSDSGAKWTKATSGTTSTLYGVGADYGDVFVSGSGGTMKRSTDRGKTWVNSMAFFGFTLYGVFRNYLSGNYLTAGSGGSIFASINYGRTWSYSLLPSTTLYAAQSVSGSTFLASGSLKVQYRTTDFGRNWSLRTAVAGTTTYGMMRDASTGTLLAVGSSGSMMRSTDSGSTWTSITPILSNTLYGGAAGANNTFLVVGSRSTVLRSTNGGTSFSKVTLATPSTTLRDADCQGTLCLIVGYNGTILRSTNTGASWTSISAPSTRYLYGVAMGSSTQGVTVGQGVAHYTTDGGKTWKKGALPTTRVLYSVVAVDATKYIATDSIGRLLTSADGGANWSIHSPGIGLPLYNFTLQGSLGLGVGSSSLRVLYTKP